MIFTIICLLEVVQGDKVASSSVIMISRNRVYNTNGHSQKIIIVNIFMSMIFWKYNIHKLSYNYVVHLIVEG